MPINARATTFTYGTDRGDTIVAEYLLGDMIDGLGGNDTITGLDGDDMLLGNVGRDTLYGMGGNDTLDGGAGNDRLYGGIGNDLLRPDSGRIGDDYVDGGDGMDTLDYSNAAASRGVRVNLSLTGVQDTLGAGKDTVVNVENVIGTRFADTVYGSLVDNILDGGLGDDQMYGFDGNDTLDGGDGNDALHGGIGTDKLLGGVGDDMLYGGNDLDNLDGGAGNDRLFGEEGNDTITPDRGGVGNDLIDGGTGIDTLNYASSSASSGVNINLQKTVAQNTGGAGIDTILNIEQVMGTNFGDVIVGNVLDNWINGNQGSDMLYGADGNDAIFAGAADYGSVNVLDGGNGDDRLVGGSGDDSLMGGAGNDRLAGDLGINTLIGGDGADLFYFNAFEANISGRGDTINDYNGLEDTIAIQSFGFVGEITFIGSEAFSASGHTEVRVTTQSNGMQLIEIDLEGNGPLDVDMAIQVIGTPITGADLHYYTTFLF